MYGGHIIIHKPVCLHITTDTKIATAIRWLSYSKVRFGMLGGRYWTRTSDFRLVRTAL